MHRDGEGSSGNRECMDDTEPKEREAAQTGNGVSAVWPPAFSSQAVGSSHSWLPSEIHLHGVRGGERESKGREKARERQRDAALLHAGAVRRCGPG